MIAQAHASPRARNPRKPAPVVRLADRLPPHSREAEAALLGALMVADGELLAAANEAMGLVTAEDFFLPTHQTLYQAIRTLHETLGRVDSVQLLETLRTAGELEAVGGSQRLTELIESVPSAAHAVHYARIVADRARRRRLLDAAAAIAADALDSPDDAQAIVERADQAVFAVLSESAQADHAHGSDAMAEAVDQMGTAEALVTGLDALDALVRMEGGDYVVLAARPSMGKTALALNIVEHLALKRDQPVAMFSLEMTKKQLAYRLISLGTGIPGDRLRRGWIDAAERAAVDACLADWSGRRERLVIDHAPGLTPSVLRTRARQHAGRFGVGAVVIDYLQLMHADTGRSESANYEVAAISKAIKALALELDVPVICLSQLNRGPESRPGHRPMLADLRDSGSIEQDADTVLFLYRPDYYAARDSGGGGRPDGLAEVIVAKQRNGPTGTLKLRFDPATTRFADLEVPY